MRTNHGITSRLIAMAEEDGWTPSEALIKRWGNIIDALFDEEMVVVVANAASMVNFGGPETDWDGAKLDRTMST